jgi:hypothetical protein
MASVWFLSSLTILLHHTVLYFCIHSLLSTCTYLLLGTTVLAELWPPHIFLSILSYQLFLISIFWFKFSKYHLQHHQSTLYVAFLFPQVFLLKPFKDLSVLSSYRRVPNSLTARFKLLLPNLSLGKDLQILYLILFSTSLCRLLVQIFFWVTFFPRY